MKHPPTSLISGVRDDMWARLRPRLWDGSMAGEVTYTVTSKPVVTNQEALGLTHGALHLALSEEVGLGLPKVTRLYI